MRKRPAPQPPPPRLPPAPPGQPKPTEPYKFEPADAEAVQAMARGEASADQQRRVLDVLINKIAGTYDQSYRPDSDRDTAFAEGKRNVGLQFVKLLNVSVGGLIKREKALSQPQ